MGYFDALTSSYFKTGKDGRRLFFPWGTLSCGYILAQEADYQRLRRQTKAYTVVTLILIIGTTMMGFTFWAVSVAAVLIAFYAIWIRSLLRGLERSDERLSVRDSMTSQALAHNATVLWLLEIVSLAFVAAGVLILAIEPGKWPMALVSIVFFGLCAATFAFMLVARMRRAAR